MPSRWRESGEWSMSFNSCIKWRRSAGSTCAGLNAAKRPTTPTASARTITTSSFSATNNARKLPHPRQSRLGRHTHSTWVHTAAVSFQVSMSAGLEAAKRPMASTTSARTIAASPFSAMRSARTLPHFSPHEPWHM